MLTDRAACQQPCCSRPARQVSLAPRVLFSRTCSCSWALHCRLYTVYWLLQRAAPVQSFGGDAFGWRCSARPLCSNLLALSATLLLLICL